MCTVGGSGSSSSADAHSRQEDNSEKDKAALERRGTQVVHDWLLGLDHGRGCLLQYLDALVNGFDADILQISAAKLDVVDASLGPVHSIEPMFWEAVGVSKFGHKIMLAKAIIALSTA